MKKGLRASLVCFCLALVAASGYLLINPVSAYATTCTSTCSNGSTIGTPPGSYACGCSGNTCTYQITSGGTWYNVHCS